MRIQILFPTLIAILVALGAAVASGDPEDKTRPQADSVLAVCVVQLSLPDSLGKVSLLFLVENVGAKPIRVPRNLEPWSGVEQIYNGVVPCLVREVPSDYLGTTYTTILDPGAVYGFRTATWGSSGDSLLALVSFPRRCELLDMPIGSTKGTLLVLGR